MIKNPLLTVGVVAGLLLSACTSPPPSPPSSPPPPPQGAMPSTPGEPSSSVISPEAFKAASLLQPPPSTSWHVVQVEGRPFHPRAKGVTSTLKVQEEQATFTALPNLHTLPIAASVQEPQVKDDSSGGAPGFPTTITFRVPQNFAMTLMASTDPTLNHLEGLLVMAAREGTLTLRRQDERSLAVMYHGRKLVSYEAVS